jgi:iron complex transport system permease protein
VRRGERATRERTTAERSTAVDQLRPRRNFVVRTPHDRVSLRLDRRTLLVGGILLTMTLACSAVALSLGNYTVSLPDIVAALFGQTPDAVRTVVVQWRLPRVVAAALFGAALGVSGAVFQSLTKNPLGSPDVIGFNMGSFTGVLLAMLAGSSGYLAIAGGALVGGLVTALAVYLLAFKRGVQGFRLIVVGIAFSAMLASLNTWILVKVDLDFAMRAAVWGAGTLNGITWEQAIPALGVMLILCLAIALLAPRMRQLELGDDTASSQGVNVERTKIAMIIVGVGFTALVTAAAGPIAFIALAAPQIAGRMTGRGAALDLASSALVGAALLGASDLVAQHAIPGVSLPVGAVTVCVGGLYLVWLLARETKRA